MGSCTAPSQLSEALGLLLVLEAVRRGQGERAPLAETSFSAGAGASTARFQSSQVHLPNSWGKKKLKNKKIKI